MILAKEGFAVSAATVGFETEFVDSVPHLVNGDPCGQSDIADAVHGHDAPLGASRLRIVGQVYQNQRRVRFLPISGIIIPF